MAKAREYEIAVKGYGEDAPEQIVHIGSLAKSMSPEQLARVLGDFVNTGGKGFATGEAVGLALQKEHRTLQRLLVLLALGIVKGIQEGVDLERGVDPRNEHAIKTARKVAEAIEAGELNCGWLI